MKIHTTFKFLLCSLWFLLPDFAGAELGGGNVRSCSKYGKYASSGNCRTFAGWCKVAGNRNKKKCRGINKASKGRSGKSGGAKKGAIFPLPKCYGLKNGGGLGAYGTPRRNGKKRYTHTGIDWYAPKGTPLRSPWAGTVTQSSYSKRAGHTVRITHVNGMRTVYMHMNKRYVSANSKLRAGQTIGELGNSGNAKRQAPHVHFELKNSKGQRLNPAGTFGCTWNSGK